MSVFHTTKRITRTEILSGKAPDWEVQWFPEYGTCFVHKYGGIEPVKWDLSKKNNPEAYIEVTCKR